MSVRAYRVLGIDYIQSHSFSMFFEEKLVEYLYDKFNFFVLLDDDGFGFAVLPIEALQSALLNVVMMDTTRRALKNDIEYGKKTGWVRYMFWEENSKN